MENAEKSWSLLPGCHKEAENLDIIFACDSAASVGQIANYVAIDLTNRNIGRGCVALPQWAPNPKPILESQNVLKKTIVINGCASRCVLKIFEQLGIRVDHEFVIQDMGVKKIPTLNIDEGETKRIADEIARKVGYTSNE
jgi:uncharacterized metal-binding protein